MNPWLIVDNKGRLSRVVGVGSLALLALAAGCAVEWTNRQPAQELAKQSRPPGSVYTGWRVFQDKCATCHGASANGSSKAPDLVQRVRDLGPRRFVGLVLQRYDWAAPAGLGRPEGPAGDAEIEDVLQRRSGTLTMPAWEGEPTVTAHIADLYAYLSARAEGTQGPGRPLP